MQPNVPILGNSRSRYGYALAAAFSVRQLVQQDIPDFLQFAVRQQPESFEGEGFSVLGQPPFALAGDIAVFQPLQGGGLGVVGRLGGLGWRIDQHVLDVGIDRVVRGASAPRLVSATERILEVGRVTEV